PLQMPINMQTVEKQKEDVPHDMQSFKDSEGHVYDFGYGLNWKGVIKDARTTRYVKKEEESRLLSGEQRKLRIFQGNGIDQFAQVLNFHFNYVTFFQPLFNIV